MRKLFGRIAILAALGLAAPALAADTANDAKDTATEKKAGMKKSARKARRAVTGDQSTADRTKDAAKDAKDTGTETKAKAKKQGRKAKRNVQRGAQDTREGAKDATR